MLTAATSKVIRQVPVFNALCIPAPSSPSWFYCCSLGLCFGCSPDPSQGGVLALLRSMHIFKETSFAASAGCAIFKIKVMDLFINFHYVHSEDTRGDEKERSLCVCVCVSVCSFMDNDVEDCD